MAIGTSLFLIAVGAILRYAVDATVAGLDIQTAGLILMVIGVVGLVIGLFMLTAGARATRRRGRPTAVPLALRAALPQEALEVPGDRVRGR
jgi:beta-lactamase regulating signal transducer with metallopeptidase domain